MMVEVITVMANLESSTVALLAFNTFFGANLHRWAILLA
jgi:hypothetical protein